MARDIGARKRAERIQAATFKISEATLKADNLQELFKSIHEIIGELMPAPNLYVALLDEAGETLSFPYYVDECDAPPTPRKLAKGVTEYVLRTGAPLQASPEVLKELTRRGETELIGAASVDWFGVPLKTKDKTIGALVVQSYTEGVKFEEEERSILVFVSAQVAMAIERKRAEEERAQLLALERAARTEAEHMNKHRSELLEREQAARAEADAARREWQTTFDMMADSVLLADCADRLIRANTAFFKSFGLAPEDSIGRSLNALLHEEPGRLPDGSKCPMCELRSQRERAVVELPAGKECGPLFRLTNKHALDTAQHQAPK